MGGSINIAYSQTMLDVTRLRVLVAVARHGSVTRAAQALNYAQPSVSHHLARLEAETGTKLIQRAGRGIRLTDAGRLLAERATEVIGRLDAAENELAVFNGLRAGRLRLAAFPSALGTIVPAAAAILHEQHPTVDLRLSEAEPPESGSTTSAVTRSATTCSPTTRPTAPTATTCASRCCCPRRCT